MKSHGPMLLVVLLIGAGKPFPQIPQVISYRGILTDASGDLVPDGPANLTFRLFDEAAEGAAQTFLSTGQASPPQRQRFGSVLVRPMTRPLLFSEVTVRAKFGQPLNKRIINSSHQQAMRTP